MKTALTLHLHEFHSHLTGCEAETLCLSVPVDPAGLTGFVLAARVCEAPGSAVCSLTVCPLLHRRLLLDLDVAGLKTQGLHQGVCRKVTFNTACICVKASQYAPSAW